MSFELGQAASVKRRFSAQDVARYIELGGSEPPPGEVPEPLVGALFSCLLGVKLPGLGTNYLKQEMEFVKTARIGEALYARVEISRLRPEKQLVDLETTCNGEGGSLICKGRALVYVGDVVGGFGS